MARRRVRGLGQSPDGRQVYHEGLFIPLLPLVRQGTFDESLMRVIRAMGPETTTARRRNRVVSINSI